MPVKREIQHQWSLASADLHDAYTDFILSRQAAHCTPATLQFYKFTAGKFIEYLTTQNVNAPGGVAARHVRAYLAALPGKSWTVNDHARAIRTLLKFWYAEKYLPAPILFDMPRVEKTRQPVLTAQEVKQVLAACDVREKAIIMLFVDTGLRRSEVIALDWQDVDIKTGLCLVKRGKGGKARSVVVGATTRRALLAYRRTIGAKDTDPLIQNRSGDRFTGPGLLQLFRRIGKHAGIPLNCHMLRRTFAILALRSGLSVLHLQALLGHSSLKMVKHYVELLDDDLLEAHEAHSPIDNLARSK